MIILRLLSLLLLLVVASGMPFAHAQSTSYVAEVVVNATAEDASAAKAEAMGGAETAGLAQLLEKLAPDQKDTIMQGLKPDRITGMVKSTEVLEEKLGAKSYRATLRLTYAADAVNQLINRKIGAVGGKEDERTSTLVVPILQLDEEKSLLWEENNTWRTAWSQVGIGQASGNMIVPYGDSVDASALAADSALAANYSAYLPLIRRYGVRDVIVLQARVKEEGKMLEVVKRSVDRQKNEVTLLTFRADPQETTDLLMMRAAREMASQINRRREETVATRVQAKTIDGQQLVIAGFASMQEWKAMREQLKALPMVQKMDVVAIAPQQVDMLISYHGSREMLAGGMMAHKISVMQNPNFWAISGNVRP